MNIIKMMKEIPELHREMFNDTLPANKSKDRWKFPKMSGWEWVSTVITFIFAFVISNFIVAIFTGATFGLFALIWADWSNGLAGLDTFSRVVLAWTLIVQVGASLVLAPRILGMRGCLDDD